MATKKAQREQQETLRAAPSANPRPPGTSPADGEVASAADALTVIARPWTSAREGGRHLILGDSGKGKSVHARWLLRELLALGAVEGALVLDDKGRDPQFQGDLRVNLEDADMHPPTNDVVVFRGDWRRGIVCSPEELAARVVAFARDETPLRLCLYLDELKRATSASEDGDGRKWLAPSCRLICTEGRSLGAWLIAGNQSPQEIPRSATDNATTIAIHRLGPIAANYLGGSWLLPSEMVHAIRHLETLEYVLHRPGSTEWDGKIYRTPKDW